MTAFQNILVYGSTLEEFSQSLTKAIQTISPDLSDHLATIRQNYCIRYGLEGAYKMLNNKTVKDIFNEYRPGNIESIASGEVDGIEYGLYESSSPEDCDEAESD